MLTKCLINRREALAKLMPNIGGPKASKRKLLTSVANSVVTYAAPILGQCFKDGKDEKETGAGQQEAGY